MKVLVLDGFKNDDVHADEICKSIGNSFSRNSEVKRVKLCEKNISPCIGCFGCWLKKPGRCLIEDDSQQIVEKMINSDIVIYLTPIVFGGYSSELKKILDRSICLVSPFFMKIKGEMHHRKRYDKYPNIIGIGYIDTYESDQVKNFKNLIYRNSINLHSPFQCADVILKDDNSDIIKNKVSALINGLEVK